MPHRSPYRSPHRLRDFFGIFPPAEAYPSRSNYGNTVSRSDRERYERHMSNNPPSSGVRVRVARDGEQLRWERRGRERRDSERREHERRGREQREDE